MPRRATKPIEVGHGVIDTSNPAGSWAVTRHAYPSTALIEFGPDWPDWSRIAQLGGKNGGIGLVQGAICKVVPPAGTPYSAIDALEELLKRGGAVRVLIMPSLPPDQAVVAGADVSTGVAVPDRSLRQVAVERAKRMHNPRDLGALLELVHEAMDYGERQP